METNETKETFAPQKLALNEILFKQYVKWLKDANPRVRRKAVHGIGGLGDVAERAIPLLEQLLKDDPDYRVRAAVEESLAGLRSNSR